MTAAIGSDQLAAADSSGNSRAVGYSTLRGSAVVGDF